MSSRRGTVSSTRIEFFTDGVFAIAATLLVLELTTHAIGDVSSSADLWASLVDMRDTFISFVVSFLLLCLLWYRHVQQFEMIARIDTAAIWLNCIRLLFVVLIPFSTSINSEYLDLWLGRLVLPLNYFLALLFSRLFWLLVSRRRSELLDADVSDAEVRRERITSSYRLGLGALAVALAPWIGPWAFLGFALDPLIARVLFGPRLEAEASKHPDDPGHPPSNGVSRPSAP